jgi:hypothetical protein
VRQVDGFHSGGQEVIGLAVPVDLDLGRARGRDAVSAGEESEQIVEAVILQIDDDDVLNVA